MTVHVAELGQLLAAAEPRAAQALRLISVTGRASEAAGAERRSAGLRGWNAAPEGEVEALGAGGGLGELPSAVDPDAADLLAVAGDGRAGGAGSLDLGALVAVTPGAGSRSTPEQAARCG